MEKEIWKDIPGYEGKYQASNLGRVKSLKRVSFRPNRFRKDHYISISEKILKQQLNYKGYCKVQLLIDSKSKTLSVHRIVAMTFIPNPEKKPNINHINAIKADNRVDNLEWCTDSENLKHCYSLGLKSVTGKYNPRAILTEQQVKMIRNDSRTNEELSEVFNVSSAAINAVRKRRNWKHIP